MKTIRRIIDINAHMENIVYQIYVDAGYAFALIGFDNLAYGTITAVKFEAKGCNSFGDIVLVDGNEKFNLIIQDIFVRENMQIRGLRVVLPNPEIRKLELFETQVCYSDGRVVSHDENGLREVIIQEYDERGYELELLKALKYRFGGGFRYKPVLCNEGWICGCGRYNKFGELCSRCGCNKTDVFQYTSEMKTEELLTAYKDAEKKKNKENLRKYVFRSFIAIIILIEIGVGANLYIMSGRRTYESEAEMKAEIQGRWTYNSAQPSSRQIFIAGDEWREATSDTDTPFERGIEWNPSRGTFTAGKNKYIVNKNGSITNGRYTYYKGGKLFSSFFTTYTIVTSYHEELIIQNCEITSDEKHTICTGKVKNVSSTTHKYIEIHGKFYEKNCVPNLDEAWTFAVGSEGLEPGESATFTLYVNKNDRIANCDVSVDSYR